MRMELSPHLDHQNPTSLYIQLYQYIKDEIMSNRMTIDSQLPSVRKLATYLGISKTTIENSYQQLLAEGYIYSKPQSGYFVNQLEGIFMQEPKNNHINEQIKQVPLTQNYEFDFKSEYVEAVNFDLINWKKHLNYVINYQPHELYSYGNLQGEEALRKAIAKYVHRTRGVNAHESNIVVGAGVQPLLQILSMLLKKQGISKIMMEDPGFNRAKNVFANNDFEMNPLEVTEKGIHMEALQSSCARLCYVSPSHQFPTGTVMLMDVRSRLIKWANDNQGYIIEDDYNSELRYEGQPIPAMKGLDRHDRVIYLGSFSTVLVPTIRLSFMLLPSALMDTYLQDKEKYAQTASKLEQLALAHMMESGDFEKHIRKIRKNYAKKSDLTLKLIERHLSSYIEVMGINSGLNILLKLNFLCCEKQIVENLKREGINVSSISEHSMVEHEKKPVILILSFRGIQKDKIEQGIIKMSNIFAANFKRIVSHP